MKKNLLLWIAMALMLPMAVRAQVPNAAVPYSTGFELGDDTSWTFINNTSTGHAIWYIGGAAYNTGSRGLYVSNNGGVSNAYTVSTATVNWAVRTFSLTAGDYAISFDWRCYGESTWDYLLCFVIPDSVTLSAGTALPTGVSYSSTPDGWTNIGGKLNLMSSWQNAVGTFSIANDGNYKLAFMWRNDGSSGQMPPAAVDNVSMRQLSCPAPRNLIVSNMTPTSATVSWTPGGNENAWELSMDDGITWTSVVSPLLIDTLSIQTDYSIRVRAICGAGDTSFAATTSFRTPCVAITDLPWTYGVEDASSTGASATFNPCVRKHWNLSTSYPQPSSTYAHGGTKSFYFYSTATAHSYLSLPLFEEEMTNLQLSFWALRNATASYGHVVVGMMSNPDDMATFDTLAVFQVSEGLTWELFEVPLANYTGNGNILAILAPAVGTNYVYVDDITVDYLPACPRPTSLRAENITANSVDFTWHDEGSTAEFILEYGPRGFVQGFGTTISVIGDTVASITGLTMGASYDVYLTAVCGDDTSTLAVSRFTTGCNIITVDDLPLFDDFESYGTSSSDPINACWIKGTSASTAYPYPSTSSAINGARGLYFYGYNSTSSTPHYSWLTLPKLDDAVDMSTLMVDFMFKRYSTVSNYNTSILMVGIADSLGDFGTAAGIDSSVVWIDTIDLTSEAASSIHSIEVSFENYTGNGRYVVFYAPIPELVGSNTYRYNYVYLDDVALRVIPTCYRPTSVALDSVTHDEAFLSWIPDARTDSPSGWKVQYGESGFVPGDGDEITVTDTTAHLTGLMPNTVYDVYVYAVCDNTESDFRFYTFTTNCAPQDTLPYVQDFEHLATGSTAAFDNCWTKGGTGTVYVTTYSGSKVLYGYKSSAAAYSYAVMPELDESIPLNTIELSFKMRKASTTASYGGRVIVLAIPGDTYTPGTPADTLGVFDMTSNDWAVQYLPMSSYAGTNRRIAFLFANSTTTYNSVHIDSVCLYPLPSCIRPSNLTVTGVSASTIDVEFDGEEGSDYRLVIASDTWADSVDITTTSYQFTGLSAQTSYTIHVYAICDASTILLGGQTSVTTGCLPVSTLPWVEGFDAMATTSSATDVPCWSHLGGGYVNITSSYHYGADGNALRFYPNSSTIGNVMLLPEFDEPISNLQLNFYTRPEGSSSGSLSVGYVTNADDQESFVEVKNLPVANWGTTYTTWTSVTATFASAPAGSRIALRHNVNSTSWYWFVDTFNVHMAPDCLPPTAVVVDSVSTSTVSVSVLGPEGSTYIYRVNATDYSDSLVTTQTNHTFTGLSGNTPYTITVAVICGDSTSALVSVDARTACSPFSLPYVEDFESYASGSNSSISPCWNKGTNNSTLYPYPYSTNAVNGQRSLYFYSYRPSSTTSTAYYSYAVLPEFAAPVDSLGISFMIRRYSTLNDAYTSRIVVGVMTDPSDITTFTAVDTVDIQEEVPLSIHGFEVYFNNYTGNGRYIALYADVPPLYGNSYSYNYVYLDDVVVDYIPTCMRPANVTFSNITTSSVNVHWAGSAASYEIEYGPEGFERGTGTVLTSAVDSVSITGLNPSAKYDVYVRALCSASDASEWSFVKTVATACGPISLPVTYTLEGERNGTAAPMPHCWTRVNNATGSVNYYPYVFNSSTYAHSGTQVLYFYMSTSSGYANDEFVVFPEIDVANFPMNSREVFLWARTSSGNHPLQIGVMNSPTDTASFVPLSTLEITPMYAEYSVDFSAYTGAGTYIALRVTMDGSSAYSIYVDDITLGTASACARAFDLTAGNATATSVQLGWTDTIGSTSWVVRYATANNDTAWTEVTATSNPFTLTGLTAATGYKYKVAPICSNGSTADFSRDVYYFGTSQVPATLPYSYNFEDSTEWAHWQTSSNSAVDWYRGNVTGGNGTNVLYLSADNGATRSWNMNSITNAVAYRDIDFGATPGCYEVTFDASVGGTYSANYDGLAVMVVDPSVYVESSSTGLISPWGHINDAEYAALFRRDSAWGSHTFLCEGISGVKRLVFYHFNQVTGASHPYGNYPPAIDNIVVDSQSCPRPYNVMASNIGFTSATITWTGAANSGYEVCYRKSGAAASTNTYHSTNTNSITLSGLDTNTTYLVWVRRICSATDTSAWTSSYPFSTICTLLSASDTIREGFEGVVGVAYNDTNSAPLPDCWITTNATNKYVGRVTNGAIYSYCIQGSQALTMTSGTSNTATGGTDNYAILPTIIEPTNNLVMSFWMCTESQTNGVLSVGYLTSASTSSFVSIKDIPASARTLHSGDGLQDATHGIYDTVDFGRVPAGNYRLAFRWTYNTSYYSVSIDDVTIWNANRCNTPVATVDTVDETYATISIEGDGTYEVAIVEGEWVEPAVVTSVSTSTYTFSNLADGTAYVIGVRAACGSDWVLLPITTIEHPCFVPTNVTTSDVTFDAATIGWTPGENETSWQINVTGPSFDSTYTSTVNPITINGLASHETYTVKVRALCSATNVSDWSTTVDFTTERCQPVSGVTATAVDSATATVTWNPSSNGSGSYEIEYGIAGFRQGNGTRVTLSATTTTLNNLDDNTTYDVYVRAYCTATLTSEWSTVVSFTTPQGQIGIEDVQFSDITLYPNPAHTTVTLSGVELGAMVSVVDLNGRTLATYTAADTTLTIDVSDMAQGAYFVRISGQQQSLVRKLIVK